MDLAYASHPATFNQPGNVLAGLLMVVDTLGPLHTRAKSRDHAIVRAQKKVSKGHPNTPPKSCRVVMDPQVKCEVIRDQALNQMLFQCIFIHAGPHT